MNAPEPRAAAAKDQAYLTIRAEILSGILPEGERLTEQRLAERLGLSRTPVREAIGRLIHEGFLERRGGYDTRVSRFPNDELDQIFQIRRLLESYGARRAAELASEEQVALLQSLCDTMAAHTPPSTEDDFRIISQANERFHATIMDAAKSPRLKALLSMAVDVGVVARTYDLYSKEDLIRSARHHQEITHAIAARSPDWAASVMASHILAAATAALKALPDR
ncbi:MAG TPA: GntR family transcriptional regulator [Rhizobiaceae bacterium]|nr:GntR family transcriptional regulator [Rhizobiaceae bacterium]